MLEQRYRELVAAVDAEFARNRQLHGARIQCRPGCSDCCHHVFSISGLEAAQIGRGVQTLDPGRRKIVQERARDYVASPPVIGARVPCPALMDGACSIYEFRPLMCHRFGMPIYNPDKPDRILACELNFRSGEEIQDPDLIRIQTSIHHSWKQVQVEFNESHAPGIPKTLSIAEAILLTSA
jgi:Fe-S-cluster containining protein